MTAWAMVARAFLPAFSRCRCGRLGPAAGLGAFAVFVLGCSGSTIGEPAQGGGAHSSSGGAGNPSSGGSSAGGASVGGASVGGASVGGASAGGASAGGAAPGGADPGAAGAGGGCEEGETRPAEDGCNRCSCADGQWACTEIACANECSQGETKVADDGCNSCSCLDGEWACTKIACASCEDGDTRKVDCNTCSCQDGSWSCTEIACAVCEDGDNRAADDGCNSCSCVEGNWLCTQRACPEEVACGGFAGDTCQKDEYCAYEEGASCGWADAQATCKPRPDACAELYDPVCGCDGETHSSACAAASQGTGVLHEGECEE